MSVRKLRSKDGAVYFCTFTCYRWLPLLQTTAAHDTIYKWMHIAYAKGYRFLGYVIMPNHVHFLVRVPQGGAINTMLGNGKRFIAYDIVARLHAAEHHGTLATLQEGVRPSDSARGQKHRVFETSTDLIECFDGKMIEQKLRYMHANPVSKKWRLAADAVDYPHSSFAFYVKGDARHAPLTPYQEFGYLVR